MTIEFTDAKRENVWLRMMLMGPTGSGKTRGALEVATKLFGGQLPVVGVDTEHGRMRLYADRYRFKHADLQPDHSPESWTAAAQTAYKIAPGGVLILDSFSHEWMGRNGILQQADRFGDWKTVRPKHSELIETLMGLPMHLIVCVRSKMKYEVSEEEVPGRDRPRQVIRKLGLGPVQDDAIIYEFDVVGSVDAESHETIFTNRCDPLVDTVRSLVPGDEVAGILTSWLSEGEPPALEDEAKDADVKKLRAALKNEGHPDAVIDEGFAKIRMRHGGVLPASYVAEKLAERAAAAEAAAAEAAKTPEPEPATA